MLRIVLMSFRLSVIIIRARPIPPFLFLFLFQETWHTSSGARQSVSILHYIVSTATMAAAVWFVRQSPNVWRICWMDVNWRCFYTHKSYYYIQMCSKFRMFRWFFFPSFFYSFHHGSYSGLFISVAAFHICRCTSYIRLKVAWRIFHSDFNADWFWTFVKHVENTHERSRRSIMHHLSDEIKTLDNWCNNNNNNRKLLLSNQWKWSKSKPKGRRVKWKLKTGTLNLMRKYILWLRAHLEATSNGP